MKKKVLLISLGFSVVLLVLTAAGGLVYRIFFLRLSKVPTGGMAATVLPGDQLVVHKVSGQLMRGIIVVFKYPNDDASYIGRIIGLPGEQILVQGQTAYINNQPLNEERVFIKAPGLEDFEKLEEARTDGSGPYQVFYPARASDETVYDPEASPDTFGIATPFVIPENHYFILGDNRENSADSRFRGAVPRDLIWGTATMIYWSEDPKSKDPREDRIFKRIK